MKLNNWAKAILVILWLSASVIGFLLKLPSHFRNMDKELHLAYYFISAAFLNFLFARRNFVRHVIIFILLFLFGVAIEYAQEYSNTFFHKRIHGRYDIEDIQFNLKGLVIYSVLWVIYNVVVFAHRKLNVSATPADHK